MGIVEFFANLFTAIKPFIIGFFVAYLLSVPCNNLEKLFSKKCNAKLANFLSVLLVTSLVLCLLGLSIGIIIPLGASSISNIIQNFPSYLTTLRNWVRSSFGNVPWLEHLYTAKLLDDLMTMLQETVSTDTLSTVSQVYTGATQFGNQAVSFLIALVASICLLYDRHKVSERIKVILVALFPSFAENFIKGIVRINEVFRQFVIGKTIDSCIIACLVFITFLIFKIPFLLFSTLCIGITNMVPVIGPIIGAIPGLLLIAGESPSKIIPYLIIVVVIQQLDAHIIGPKCIGKQTGLTTFWVLFAVIIGGKLFGILGMFFGVPIFAVLYDMFNDFINNRVKTSKVKSLLEEEKGIDIE